jgi:hypothetical protein
MWKKYMRWNTKIKIFIWLERCTPVLEYTHFPYIFFVSLLLCSFISDKTYYPKLINCGDTTQHGRIHFFFGTVNMFQIKEKAPCEVYILLCEVLTFTWLPSYEKFDKFSYNFMQNRGCNGQIFSKLKFPWQYLVQRPMPNFTHICLTSF